MHWQEFFDTNQIEYVTRGPNTKRGELSVKCPFCGEDDPSQHLGISLDKDNWGCLRNPMHRGHSAPRLIAAILGCSYPQAKLLAAQYSTADPNSLDTALLALEPLSEAPRPTEGLEPLPDFRGIEPKGSTTKFWRYLERRGFTDPAQLIGQYNLKCCLTGRFKDRLMLPFYQGGQLIAWTGRAISNPVHAARYLSSKLVKTTIFNEDNLYQGGDLLFVVEGPFDALKMDYYGQEYGARATCIFGVNMTVDQIVILSQLRRRFKKVVVLFDYDAVEPSFLAIDWLQAANITLGQLPKGVKDPGSMSANRIVGFIQQVL